MDSYIKRLVVSLVVLSVSTFVAFVPGVATATAPVVESEVNPTATTTTYVDPKPALIAVAEAAQTGSLYDWLDQLGEYESGNRPDIKHLDVNGRYSYGCLQFQMGTWLAYGKSLGATESNIYDCSLQKRVAHQMITEKYSNWRHWSYTVQSRMGVLPPR